MGLQRVGSRHAFAEQTRAERLSRATHLLMLEGDRPSGRLDGEKRVAVSRSAPDLFVHCGAPFVAVTTEKLGDLGLEHRLQQQAGAEDAAS